MEAGAREREQEEHRFWWVQAGALPSSPPSLAPVSNPEESHAAQARKRKGRMLTGCAGGGRRGGRSGGAPRGAGARVRGRAAPPARPPGGGASCPASSSSSFGRCLLLLLLVLAAAAAAEQGWAYGRPCEHARKSLGGAGLPAEWWWAWAVRGKRRKRALLFVCLCVEEPPSLGEGCAWPERGCGVGGWGRFGCVQHKGGLCAGFLEVRALGASGRVSSRRRGGETPHPNPHQKTERPRPPPTWRVRAPSARPKTNLGQFNPARALLHQVLGPCSSMRGPGVATAPRRRIAAPSQRARAKASPTGCCGGPLLKKDRHRIVWSPSADTSLPTRDPHHTRSSRTPTPLLPNRLLSLDAPRCRRRRALCPRRRRRSRKLPLSLLARLTHTNPHLSTSRPPSTRPRSSHSHFLKHGRDSNTFSKTKPASNEQHSVSSSARGPSASGAPPN